MMEAGWSARSLARQVGCSDLTVRRCWDQWTEETAFTRRPGSARYRQTSRREDRHIKRHAFVEPTASLAAVQTLAALLLRASVSSRTIARHLDERHPTATEWNHAVFSDESRFNLSSEDNCVRVWRPRDELLNLTFTLQRHTAPTAGVMVWDAIAYDTRSYVILIHGTMTAQRYVHNIFHAHVLPIMAGPPGAIFQQGSAQPHTTRMSQDGLYHISTFPWSTRSPDLSPIEHIWDHLGW
ncbi:transposable element Tcb2 transposase [Trichonephila clavipes]|nr:transposable element Tcb2 transposase [Trichonephila clavipes]